MSLRNALISAFLFSSFSFAQAQDAAVQLKLLPAPKQVELRQDSFEVRPTTRIYLAGSHAKEDRLAADMLVIEIHDWREQKLAVEMSRAVSAAASAIVLGRLDDAALRATLEAKGVKIEKDFNDEGYVIWSDKTRVIVAGQSAQGLFYGVQTLRQLIRPEGDKLICPGVSIKDWPSMKWRGVHDDISRGPIPTMDYFKKEIRTLAEYKINMFALYMEHVFDYKSQPLVAPREGALTPAQIKELVDYASQYYVTIVPEGQTFGHLHHALKYEVYDDIAEVPHGHVLTPTQPATYDFVKSVYSDLVPLFPGPFIHIGADETFELGQGQTKDLIAKEGAGKVYLDHLSKVFEVLKPYNKQLMFWGDIAVKYPELLNILPKNMIAVTWQYNAAANFDSYLQPYKNAGLTIMVAPGANNWNAMWPNLDVAYVNIRNFVRDGQKFGAIGMLNTTWDDDGEALFEMTWPAMVFGAAASWQPGESSIDNFKNSYDWAFYRNQDLTFRDVLEHLDSTHAAIQKAGFEGAMDYLYWADNFSKVGAAAATQMLPAMKDVRLHAEHAVESLYRNRDKARAHEETLEAMVFAGWRLDSFGMKVQFASEIGHLYAQAYQNAGDQQKVSGALDDISSMNGRLQDLRDEATRMRRMYAEAWLRENRPYWLDNVLVRYDNLANQYQQKIVQMYGVQGQFWMQKTLPTPQSLGFYMQ